MRKSPKRKSSLPLLLVIACVALVLTLYPMWDPDPDAASENTYRDNQSVSDLQDNQDTEGQAAPVARVESFDTLNGDLITVHYIDVGQADAAFVELPNGDCMLIDGGNRGDGDLVVDYIADRGYQTIDYVVASHPHEDHIGGLPDVFAAFDVLSIYMPDVAATTNIYKTLTTSIEKEGITPHLVQGEMMLLEDKNLAVSSLGPTASRYDDMNDYSVIIKITYGSVSFLFTGDATTVSENLLTGDVSADVLKVGHHGSSTSSSSSFLRRVSPTIAIFSVGEDNDYGHPHKEVWERITSMVQTVLRTDENGTIIVASDSRSLAYATSK